MKKWIINLLFILCITLSLVGCQKKNDDADNFPKGEKEEVNRNILTEKEEIESVSTEVVTEEKENNKTQNNQTTSKKSIFSNKLQDWQVNYCKILLGVLGGTEEIKEHFGDCWGAFLQDDTSVGATFRLMDIDKDMIPELLVGNVLFFPDGKSQACISGIKEETNQLILYENYNIEDPMYVANVKNSELDIEFVIWHEADEWSGFKKQENVKYGRYSDYGTNISEAEYSKLLKEYQSNVFLPKGIEVTLDNIEKHLHIQFPEREREFLNILVQEEKSFDRLQYAQIYFNDDNIPDYVIDTPSYSFEIYIHDGQKFHILGQGDNTGEKLDFLLYGVNHISYLYYKKQGVLNCSLWDEDNLKVTYYDSFFKLNDEYELEYEFDLISECEFDEMGEEIKGTQKYYYADDNQEKQECSKKTYNAKMEQFGEGKYLDYEEDVAYTNAIDLVIGSIKVKN